ncbi:hypothetical protein V1282_003522 [Nitrobacteraceae bacterium AZCC 2146]
MWVFTLLALAAGYWLYTDYEASGNLSGKSYYETCWKLKTNSRGFNTAVPSTPYEAGQWKQCEPVARRALFGSGLIFSGQETGEEFDRLRDSCPNSFSEIPMGGLFYLYVKDVEDEGGVNRLFGMLPAKWSVGSWAAKRWPKCNAERERQGYPKIVETKDGTFSWEKPCPKCK